MAILHLIDKGHKDISVITGPVALQNEQERLRGYRSAMRRSGLTVPGPRRASTGRRRATVRGMTA